MILILFILFYATYATPNLAFAGALGILPTANGPPLSPVFESTAAAVEACTCSNERSIWDIIWSCFVTLFACSWVSVHPDVPAPDEKWWRTTVRRTELMFWTILTPELVIYWAARQWLGARRIAKEQIDHQWTQAHGHFLQMGGLMLYLGTQKMGVLSYERFKELIRCRRIDFPQLTEEDIVDRSKNDSLSKGLVLIQTSWFILQCITRKVKGLPITELELATLGFCVLNGCMYFFWWNKPFDVKTPIPLYLITNGIAVAPPPARRGTEKFLNVQDPNASDSTPRNASCQLKRFLRIVSSIASKVQSFRRIRAMAEDEDQVSEFEDPTRPGEDIGPMKVPIFYALMTNSADDNKLVTLIPLIGAVFGAIHCAGWSFEFPTKADLWIWRTSSILIASLPPYFLATIRLGDVLEQSNSRLLKVLSIFLYGAANNVGLPLYIISRLLLLVEMLITLRHLPPEIYSVIEWTTFIPHI